MTYRSTAQGVDRVAKLGNVGIEDLVAHSDSFSYVVVVQEYYFLVDETLDVVAAEASLPAAATFCDKWCSQG